jgi:type I restriction enzyme S subunit
MNKIQQLLQQLCPEGVEFKKLWEVTAWDKKFNGLDKHMQKKVIIYPYVLANKFKELELEKGNVRLLSTGNYIGWTTEELAGKHLCEGEIVAIPWGGKANIKYCKGKFVTADNRIATSLDTKLLLNKFLYY